MSDVSKKPGRRQRDYQAASRWVAKSHALTERTKDKRTDRSTLAAYLATNWFQWLYHYAKSRFGPRHPYATYDSIKDNGVYRLTPCGDDHAVTIALVADWGTDTIESVAIADSIRRREPDYTIHLGDTYFVGAPFEVANNFDPANRAWHYGAVGSFALPGNHEMYSNGDAYFDTLLPWMGLYQPERMPQKASFFCLENDWWRIVGLDTGYRSVGVPFLEFLTAHADLRQETLDWLRDALQLPEDNRGLVLLTHHQSSSAFDKAYPRAARQLRTILGDRPVLWFWGHEHRFALYGKSLDATSVPYYGRCIGNGGMPTSLHSVPDAAKIGKSNLVLYDNRYRTTVAGTPLGHNGYAWITIEKENLTVEYCDEHAALVTEEWRYEIESRQIVGVEISNACTELTLTGELLAAIGGGTAAGSSQNHK